MRKKYIFGKKLYISVLTSILVLLTTVATTFAWVGVFANSTFESFDVNLFSSSLDEYGIEVSATGVEGTFSETIQSNDIKKQILINWGIPEYKITQNNINDLFTQLKLEQCTSIPNVDGDSLTSLGEFSNLQGEPTHSLFKFDVYVSAKHNYDSGQSSDYMLDVYLNKGLMSGNSKKRLLINPFIYPSNFINPLSSINTLSYIQPLTADARITTARVNAKSVCRVAFEKYEVVNKYDVSAYTGKKPKSCIIYSGDSYNYPTYNSNDDTYEFGGILEDDLNLAIGYYNSTEWKYTANGIKTVSVTDPTASIYGGELYSIRGTDGTHPDLIFSSKTNHLIDSSKDSEKIGINQMMKITIYFWIEGWDSDCWNVTGNSPVTISVSMSLVNEDEF